MKRFRGLFLAPFIPAFLFSFSLFLLPQPAARAALALPADAPEADSTPANVVLDPETARGERGVPSASIVAPADDTAARHAVLAASHAEERLERIRTELGRIDSLARADLRQIRLWRAEAKRISALAGEAARLLEQAGADPADREALIPLSLDINEDLRLLALLEERMESAHEGILRMAGRSEPGGRELRLAFEWLHSLDEDADRALLRMKNLWRLAAEAVRTTHSIERENRLDTRIARGMVEGLKQIQDSEVRGKK